MSLYGTLEQKMTVSNNMEELDSQQVDVVSMSEDESGSEDNLSEISGSVAADSSGHQENGSPGEGDDKQKRYYCDTCSASFTMIGNLNRHKKSHLHHRPYTCNFCLRGFLRRTSYVEHVRLHTGEKPYKCNYCTQSFVRKKCHQMHIRKCAAGIPDNGSPPQTSSTSRDKPFEDQPTESHHQKEDRRPKHSNHPITDNLWKNVSLPFNQLLNNGGINQPAFTRSTSIESTTSPTSPDINSALFQHLRNPSLAYAGLLNKSLFPKPPLPFLPGFLPSFGERPPFRFEPPADKKMLSPPTLPSSLKREEQSAAEAQRNMIDRFVSLNSLQKDRKLWQCKVCDIYFTDHYLYLSHVSMHGEENPLTCNLCKKACKTVHEFLMHH